MERRDLQVNLKKALQNTLFQMKHMEKCTNFSMLYSDSNCSLVFGDQTTLT